MTTRTMIRRLKALRDVVLADGKIDWEETDRLLEAVRPLASKHRFVFEDYERLLLRCRQDGRITPEESQRLALYLDYLCGFFSNMLLKGWIAALAVLLVAFAIYALVVRVIEAL